jgi:general secretion pathway protein D
MHKQGKGQAVRKHLTPLWLALGLWLALLAPLHGEEGVTLNLKDADIEAVITTVSEITGKNFIVDPRVKGKITIISARPLDADALYQTFLAVLDVHGFAAVPGEGTIKILPAASARQSAGLVTGEGDGGGGNDYVTRVFHVDQVKAQELVPILRPLLPQDGHLAAVSHSNALIASGLAGNIDRLEQIIARIDRREDQQVEVIRLSYASAAEVVRVMNSLNSAGKDQVGGVTLVADERTNSVLLGGAQGERLRYRALITHLDTPLENEGSVEVIYLNYADARELVRILNGVSRGIQEDGKGGETKGEGNVFIEADESSNALVINAPPDVLRSLKSVVRKLDFRRVQIHVEAVIAEVSSETAKEFGIQWGFFDARNEAGGGVVNFSGSGGGIIDLGVAVNGGNIPVVDGLTLAIGDLGSSVINIAAVLRALAADANNNILATPSLMTMDNQEAEIGVGKEVPFVTGSYTSTGAGSNPTNPFQTYERKNVGLSLKVRPQVNEGDAVKLTIVQEVSSLASTTAGAADLITNKRTLSTAVMVDDGETIVLGGLIDEALTDSEQRVPLVGDIPVLGQLFRYDRTEKTKTNLMIFLRPTIVRDSLKAGNMAGEKYSYIRAQQLAARERPRGLLPAQASPLLPEWQGGKPALGGSDDSPAPEAAAEVTEQAVQAEADPHSNIPAILDLF